MKFKVNMRWAVSIVIIVSLLISGFMFVSAAEKKVNISLSGVPSEGGEVTANAGEDVSITFSAKSDDIKLCILDVIFDYPSVLTYKSSSTEDTAFLSIRPDDKGDLHAFASSPESIPEEITGTITFTVNNDAEGGDYSIGLVINQILNSNTFSPVSQDDYSVEGISLKVLPSVKSVTISAPEDVESINVGEELKLTAVINPENAFNTNVTWKSSNPDVATVSDDGVITGVGSGTATITVTTENGELTDTYDVTVVNEVTNIKFDDDSPVTLDIGETKQLNITIEPDDADDMSVTWSSSNDKVASVDENGVVTANAAGKATITVTSSNGIEVTRTIIVNSRTIPLTVMSGEDFWIPITVENCEAFGGITATLDYDTDLLTLNTLTSSTGILMLTTDNNESGVENRFVATNMEPNKILNGDVIIGYAFFTAKEGIEEEVKTMITVKDAEVLNAASQPITDDVDIPRYEVTIKPVPPLPGDANLNDELDLVDAILILQHLSESNELTGRALQAADADCDGTVNTVDAIVVMLEVL